MTLSCVKDKSCRSKTISIMWSLSVCRSSPKGHSKHYKSTAQVCNNVGLHHCSTSGWAPVRWLYRQPCSHEQCTVQRPHTHMGDFKLHIHGQSISTKWIRTKYASHCDFSTGKPWLTPDVSQRQYKPCLATHNIMLSKRWTPQTKAEPVTVNLHRTKSSCVSQRLWWVIHAPQRTDND